MADVSATIRVNADTARAEERLKRLGGEVDGVKESADRAQEAASAATGGGNGGGPVPPVDTKQAARDMADEFGKRAGATMGKFIGSFIVSQGVGTAFSLMREVGRDNRRLDQAEATVNGAVQYATMGAQIAGPLGLVVGGLLGGLNAFIGKEKEIQDGIRQARLDYDRERKYAKLDSAARQEQSWFDWSMGFMTPQRQVSALRERGAELSGTGSTADETLESMSAAKSRMDESEREVKRLEAEKARLEEELGVKFRERIIPGPGMEMSVATSILPMSDGRRKRTQDELDAVKARLETAQKTAKADSAGYNKAYLDAINAALEGRSTDAKGKVLEIGGNEYGTRNFWETVYNYALRDSNFGKDDERTQYAKKQLDIVNEKIDPLQEKESAVYQSEMSKMLGLASRGGITDSLSSKGLVVGAQVGAMGNDKIVSLVQDFMRQAREGNKSMVEAIRDRGGIEGMRREFAEVL